MSKDHLQSFTWVAWLCSYLSHAHEMTKNIFLYSYSIYKHDAIDVADPNNMQGGCHVNFVIDLGHWRVSVAKW